MDQTIMLRAATILLLLTAAGGVFMAIQRLTRKTNPPHWLAMAHGLLAAAGLTLLIYAVLNENTPSTAIVGLIMLLVAATGGVIMNLFYHLADKLLPQWLLHLHIALAAVGTGFVAWASWGV